ncbi:phosphatidylglycerol lysyltransferase domain-containing protein [Paractinoplanes atraurantiacus]
MRSALAAGVVVAVASIIAGGILLVTARGLLLDDVRSAADDRADQVAAAVASGDKFALRFALREDSWGSRAQVVDPAGTVVARSGVSRTLISTLRPAVGQDAYEQAVARMRRAGFECRIVRQRDLSPTELAEVIARADALRDGKAERGFSIALSRLGDPDDGDCLLVLCRDETGALRGVLNFVPWGRAGLSLDLMRGDRTAPNGLTELMIVATVEYAAAAGLTRVSLNFAVLREVFARGEELGAGPFTRIGYRALMLASRVWQIESLYRANAKFQPDWQPRYLCYPSARALPRVTVAAMNAELTGARS